MRFLLTSLLALIPSMAAGHSSEHGMSYPPFCCAGSTGGVAQSQAGDCQAIPSSSVEITPNGFVLNLKPGDHHMVTRPATHLVPYGNERRSEDGDFISAFSRPRTM